jgi:serine/threonine protein phosphatase 1
MRWDVRVMRWLSRLSLRPTWEPQLGPGQRVYAIGDIHGRADLLDRLLKQIEEHAQQNPSTQKTLVLLGDYIDRGKDSKAVLSRLESLNWPGWKLVFLRGNHDQAVLDFLADANFYRAWKHFGAAATLLSYGVMPPRFERETEFAKARDELASSLPRSHVEFLQKLELSYTQGDYYFCHAGVRPGISLEDQVAEDLLWIRDEFLYYRHSLGKMVVHGHTPAAKPTKTQHRIGVDTGAHATNCLTAVVLEGKDVWFLQTTARPAPLTADAYL